MNRSDWLTLSNTLGVSLIVGALCVAHNHGASGWTTAMAVMGTLCVSYAVTEFVRDLTHR